jgi:hypothetical protein
MERPKAPPRPVLPPARQIAPNGNVIPRIVIPRVAIPPSPPVQR